MYSQVDPDEKRYQLLDHITHHRKDCHAIEPDDLYIKTRSAKRRMRHTTAGWDLLVEYKDKSKQWIPFKDTEEFESYRSGRVRKVEGH